ncbi:hypothetical protein DL770_009018 [Monosporascus sp. CRB-9-2]|nr:hypothetical protein DL770_009018 [Monosporascus sp. CRB-9-2]
MTGVDKLHEQGVKCNGVRIAVIDTGVNYRHLSLGGGFGPGHKIAFGTNSVVDDYDSYNDPVPDDGPIATCLDGAHVPVKASGLRGVAREATLGMHRVFGCRGEITDDVLIRAMLQAAEEGADLLSISIGSKRRWESLSVYASVTKQIVEGGVAVIVAAGNDGSDGPFALSDPTQLFHAFGVRSVENEIISTMYHAHDNINWIIEYFAVLLLEGNSSFCCLVPASTAIARLGIPMMVVTSMHLRWRPTPLANSQMQSQ